MPFIHNLLSIFFIISFFFLAGCSNRESSKPQASNGFINLSDYDFTTKGNVHLDGEWEFYPGKIITPQQFDSGKTLTKHFITQPTNWKNKIYPGAARDSVKLDPFGTATYRLKVLLKKNSGISYKDSIKNNFPQIFGLKVIEVHSAYKLWINGILFHHQGKVSTKQDDFIPSIKPYTGFFIPDNDTVEIIINASNYFDRKMAGMDDRVILGLDKDITEDTNAGIFFFIFSAGILLVMSIYNFLLYFIRKEEKLHWYLGVISFLFSVQSLWEGEKAIFFIVPLLDFSIYMTIWMLTLNVFALLLFFYNILFPEEVNKKYAFGSLAVLFLFSVISIFTPYSFHGLLLDYILYFGLLLILYLMLVLIKAYRMKRKFSGLALLGFFVPMTFGINDLLFGLDLIVTGYYSPIGFVIFIVIQSFVISSKFARSYDKVIELSNDLKTLNENLEKAVEERTEELKAANSELSILNKQKDRFFSIISHDLKNPFNVLINSTDYLRKTKTTDPEELSGLHEILYDSAIKGYNLLENLLEWSTLQFSSVKPKAVNIKLYEILQETREHFEKQLLNKNIKLVSGMNKDAVVHCEPDAIRTILRNLIGNAIKFSFPQSCIHVSLEENYDQVKIKIKDHGIGIPEDKQEKIFMIDTKYQRQGTSGETGSGMGLIIIKELVERSGGSITFTSELNKGTEFVICLQKDK